MGNKKKKKGTKKTFKQELEPDKYHPLLKVCVALILIALVIVPVIFDTFTFDPFDLIKNNVFRIIVSLMVLFFLGYLAFSKRPVVNFHPALYPLFLFVLVAGLATILSVEPWLSFWGKYRRYEGFVSFLTYAVFLFIAINAFRNKKHIELAVKVSLATGAAISIYGILQYLGIDFFRWGTLPFEVNRSFATLGNPALLAGYLVTILPLGLGLTVFSRDRLTLLFASGSTVLVFVCLITTFNRTSWIAAFLAIIALAVSVIVLWRRGAVDRETVSNLIIITSAIIIFFIAIAVQSAATGKTLTVVERLKEINVLTGSFQHRLEIWGAGFRMVAESPLLGLGPDTFRSTSRMYQGPGYGLIAPDIVADNAHNYEIQIASGTGMLGFMFFAALVVYIFLEGARILFVSSLKGDRVHYESTEELASIGVNLGLFISFLAYFFQLLTSVSIIGSTIMWWFVFAGILAQSPVLREKVVAFRTEAVRYALVGAGIVAFIATTVVHINQLTADYYYFKGKAFINYPAYLSDGEQLIRKAIELNPHRWEYPIEIARGYYSAYNSTGNQAYLDRAIQYALYAQHIDDHEADIKALLVQCYILKSRTDSAYLEDAFQVAQRMYEMMPYHYVAPLSLGTVHYYRMEYEEAAKYLKIAAELNPRSAVAFYYLGQTYRALGDEAQATIYYEQAVKLNPALKQRLNQTTASAQ